MSVSRLRAALAAAFIATLVANAAVGQTGAAYDLHWNTQAGGGAAMAGAGYALTGTVGPSATGAMQNGALVLRGGFWAGVHEAGDTIFGNGFESAP